MKPTARILLTLTALILVSLACQAAGPVTNLFATPTPTFTVTPSPTFTPSPTMTPTITPSPTPRPTGIQFETTAGGQIRITDYDSGYILVLSRDWFLIPTDKDELRQAIKDLSASEPDMAESLRAMDLLDDDAIRMISMNRNPQYRDKDLFTNLIALSIDDPIFGNIPMDIFVELNVEQITQNVSYATVVDSGVGTNDNKVEYGYITMSTRVNERIRPINVTQNLISIRVGTTFTIFNVTVPSTAQGSARQIVDEILGSLYLLDTVPANDG